MIRNIAEIFSIVAPAFILIGAGLTIRRLSRLNSSASSGITQIVFYIAVPALLFRSIAHSDFTKAFPETAILTIYITSVLTAAIAFLTAALFRGADPGVISQGVYRSNMVFLGLPIIANTFGSDTPVIATVAILIGLTVPMYNLLAVAVLSLSAARKTDGRVRFRRITQDVILNPLILSSAAGIIWSLAELSIPLFLDRSLEMAGVIAAPLALISVGISLDLSYLRSRFRQALLVSFLKLTVYPAAVFFALVYLNQSPELTVSAVILTASPTAVVSFIMAREMGGDENLSAAIVVATTLLSMFTLSAWLAVFRWLGMI